MAPWISLIVVVIAGFIVLNQEETIQQVTHDSDVLGYNLKPIESPVVSGKMIKVRRKFKNCCWTQ